MDVLIDRVAGLDVHRDTVVAAVRVGGRGGGRRGEVRTFATTGAGLTRLAGWLSEQRVSLVGMESTPDYWRPFYYLLEARGLTVWLVNARDVKNVPGRPKTDKLDAIWLAKLNERGMLRPSFVPPPEIREIRNLTRLRLDLTAECTRHRLRVEKLLEDALIKLSTVLSDIFGVSGRAMLDALVAGERDPKKLAALARGRVKATQAELATALTGQFTEHHGYLLSVLLAQIDGLDRRIAELTERIDTAIAALPAPAHAAADAARGGETGPDGDATTGTGQGGGGAAARPGLDILDRLDEIPGIARHAAQVIIAEIGTDMAQFPTSGHLNSWAKLTPQTIQSGAKSRTGRTGKGNPYLRGALGEAAMAAAKTKTFLGSRYRRLVKRRGHLKALVAVARSILTIVWHLLNDPTARFHDLGVDYHASLQSRERRKRNALRELKSLNLSAQEITALLAAA